MTAKHSHDWRVDPSQVIIMLRDERRVRIVCPECNAVAVVFSRPDPIVNAGKPSTWRPYYHKNGDTIRIEPDHYGRA